MKKIKSQELEGSLQSWFKACLKQLGIYCFRHNTMNACSSRRFARVSKDELGNPDLFLLVCGRLVGCEMKMEGKELSENQKLRKKEIEENGGIYLKIDNRNDALRILAAIRWWCLNNKKGLWDESKWGIP